MPIPLAPPPQINHSSTLPLFDLTFSIENTLGQTNLLEVAIDYPNTATRSLNLLSPSPHAIDRFAYLFWEKYAPLRTTDPRRGLPTRQDPRTCNVPPP